MGKSSGKSFSSGLKDASSSRTKGAVSGARKDVLAADLSSETELELLSKLGAKNGFKSVNRTLNDISLGDSTALGRRENLRFRTEIQRDRPGRKGLIFG